MDEDRDRILELLWQNGPVTQSQRSVRKSTSSDFGADVIPDDQSTRHNGRPQSLFVQEDEMASWLHYPLNDTAFPGEFCSDLLYSSPPCVNAAGTMTAVPITASDSALVAPTPPILQSLRSDNFGQFSRNSRFDESGPSNSNRAVKESTVLDSSATPTVPPQLRVPDVRERLPRGNTSVAASVTVPAASSADLCDASVTSTLGGFTESADPPTPRGVPILLPEDRKRKGQEPDCGGGDFHSEKRRDRINERMKTLQELIPNCNKADKASMLDEAIEYLKSLQLQLQMISMGGCSSMVPTMMFPAPHGVLHQQQQQQQHYIMPQQHIGGMGMGIGMNHPMMMMMPFPNNNVLTAAAGNLGVAHPMLTPRFPMQPPMFHNMQQQQQQQQNFAVAGGVADPAAARFPFPQAGGGSHLDPTMLSSSSSNSNPAVINPNMADHLYHHHQYLNTLHHLNKPPHPNQEMQHNRSKVKASENLERQPKG